MNKISAYGVLLVMTMLLGSVPGLSAQIVGSDEFAGSQACGDCHQDEAKAWQGSDHDMAMQHANSSSVLGNFDDARVIFAGQVNRFFKKGDEYWVNMAGPSGEFNDYQISYTFGFEPLQQYMVEFADGRIQLIPFAWDARPQGEGGQRWYHLYPQMTATDPFYWLNAGQNWNFMCADCHSTNVQKNYDVKTNSYQTSWSEINVGCEACHGPASEHLNWAKNQKTSTNNHYGFNRDLGKPVQQWLQQAGHSTLQPQAINSTDQIMVCAQCHSRRSQLNDQQAHMASLKTAESGQEPTPNSLLNSYLPSLISAGLYHNDGQIYDEDYVYGSFMQSKMATKGVTCSNCHDPHSTKLVVAEEAVCGQCHTGEAYSAAKHSFHADGTKAAQCTSCHMPETTYMGVDARRDHSWQIPRPDLSKNIGTPNVCTQCHDDKTADWADKQLGQWFPDSRYRNQPHFAVAFYAADINYRDAAKALSYTAQDINQAAIIRASALSRLATYPGKNTLIALARAVKDGDELIRLGAVQGSASYTEQDRWQILAPLLTDAVLAIRTETAAALAAYWPELSAAQRQQITPALNEYMDIQSFNADRGFGRTNLANIYRAQGQLMKAKQAYLGAIAIEPYFVNSYVNLADLYRQQGADIQGLALLKQGMLAQPKSAALPYSAGLALLRLGQKQAAVGMFKQATVIDTENGQYWYVYGLSMVSSDFQQAAGALAQAFDLSGNPEHLFARCDILLTHQAPQAQSCINRLAQYAPKNVIAALSERL